MFAYCGGAPVENLLREFIFIKMNEEVVNKPFEQAKDSTGKVSIENFAKKNQSFVNQSVTLDSVYYQKHNRHAYVCKTDSDSSDYDT